VTKVLIALMKMVIELEESLDSLPSLDAELMVKSALKQGNRHIDHWK
jgi:hypothetical protein